MRAGLVRLPTSPLVRNRSRHRQGLRRTGRPSRHSRVPAASKQPRELSGPAFAILCTSHQSLWLRLCRAVISVAFRAKIFLRELWWSAVPHLGAGFAGYSVIRVACSEELSTRFLPMAEMLR
jgi:hypothetical protein